MISHSFALSVPFLELGLVSLGALGTPGCAWRFQGFAFIYWEGGGRLAADCCAAAYCLTGRLFAFHPFIPSLIYIISPL